MATDTLENIANETRRILCEPDTEYSQKNLSGKISSGTHSSQTANIQHSIAKPPLAPSHSVWSTDIQTEKEDQTKRTLFPKNRASPPEIASEPTQNACHRPSSTVE